MNFKFVHQLYCRLSHTAFISVFIIMYIIHIMYVIIIYYNKVKLQVLHHMLSCAVKYFLVGKQIVCVQLCLSVFIRLLIKKKKILNFSTLNVKPKLYH